MRKRRRQLAVVLGTIGLVVTLVPATALAEKPSSTCPAAASGWQQVDPDGWWEITVGGFAEEGIAVYQPDGAYTDEFEAFAQSFGFADAAEAEFFVKVVQWASIDRNANGYACIKDLPNTPSHPGFIFNGTDDNASVPLG